MIGLLIVCVVVSLHLMPRWCFVGLLLCTLTHGSANATYCALVECNAARNVQIATKTRIAPALRAMGTLVDFAFPTEPLKLVPRRACSHGSGMVVSANKDRLKWIKCSHDGYRALPPARAVPHPRAIVYSSRGAVSWSRRHTHAQAKRAMSRDM